MIKQILNNPQKYHEMQITIKGWLTNNRGNLKIKFVELNDGSTVENLQLVVKDEENIKIVEKARLGAALEVSGVLNYTPNAAQSIELVVDKFILLKNTDEDYPIQKKETSYENLREYLHLRHHTSTIKATMLIRSTLLFELHNFFINEGFLNCASPIITSNDGEGAGETFVVDGENDSKNFFNNTKATLGVTGQLQGEAYANGFKKIYTFAPTFRAEKSNTKKHLAEFWMVEPEVAFYDLKQIINLADKMLRFVLNKVIVTNKAEIEYLSKKNNVNLFEKINLFLDNKLNTITYANAVEELKKVSHKFEEQNIFFGMDLKTEHERYIAEEIFKGPVAVTNYPKKLKAFYMHQDDNGQTVSAFDLLVPGIGELIGGSQRETRYDKLLERVLELGMNQEELQWYLDLRRFGDCGSAGFGLGFERLVMYVTGMDNIREVIPFPRTYGNLKL